MEIYNAHRIERIGHTITLYPHPEECRLLEGAPIDKFEVAKPVPVAEWASNAWRKKPRICLPDPDKRAKPIKRGFFVTIWASVKAFFGRLNLF